MHLFKRLVFLGIFIALPLMLGACNKKTNKKMCKTNADCRLDASGKELNGVCHNGSCEECVENTDCTGLKQCINFRCESTCQLDADCGANMHCENNICIKDCVSNAACGADMVCARGRCMSQAQANQQIAGCDGIERVHFDFDRFDIRSSERGNLELLAECLRKNPEKSIWLEGHADERGTETYNMILGEHRATAVKDYLIKQEGIAKDRLKTVSYGAQRPMAEGQNEEAWQQNRRAEFRAEK